MNGEELRDSLPKTLLYILSIAIIFIALPTVIVYRVSYLYPEIMESENIKIYSSSWIIGTLIILWSYLYHRAYRGSYYRLTFATINSLLIIYWMWGVLGSGYANFFYKDVQIEIFYPILFITIIAISAARIVVSFLQFLGYRKDYLEATGKGDEKHEDEILEQIMEGEGTG